MSVLDELCKGAALKVNRDRVASFSEISNAGSKGVRATDVISMSAERRRHQRDRSPLDRTSLPARISQAGGQTSCTDKR